LMIVCSWGGHWLRSGGPGGTLRGARVLHDAALEVEGHDGAPVGCVGGPAGVAGGGEVEPAPVHLVGEGLRRRVAGDGGPLDRAGGVEYERASEGGARLQAPRVLRGGPGELVHPGAGRVAARLGEADVREPEEVVGGGGGEQLARRRVARAVGVAQPAGLGAV